MKSSIQDVAQLAHVSISTVSRSFTRPDLVSKATRDKVMKAADELNFSISRSAAALKTGRALRIAVLISGRLNLWFSSSIMEGLNEPSMMKATTSRSIRCPAPRNAARSSTMLPGTPQCRRRNRHFLRHRQQRNQATQVVDVPIIGINSSLPEERGFNAAVRIDDKQGSELAARHLITLGHRDIAYIRTDREVTLHFSVQGRFDSFMTCCKSNGVEPRVFVTDEGKNNVSKVVTQLLSSDHMPTAIACQEDGIAIPLLFQHDATVSQYRTTSHLVRRRTYARDLGLTTIRQTPVEMAHEAARMTLALIDKQPLDEPFKTFSRTANRPIDHRQTASLTFAAHCAHGKRTKHRKAVIAEHCDDGLPLSPQPAGAKRGKEKSSTSASLFSY